MSCTVCTAAPRIGKSWSWLGFLFWAYGSVVHYQVPGINKNIPHKGSLISYFNVKYQPRFLISRLGFEVRRFLTRHSALFPLSPCCAAYLVVGQKVMKSKRHMHELLYTSTSHVYELNCPLSHRAGAALIPSCCCCCCCYCYSCCCEDRTGLTDSSISCPADMLISVRFIVRALLVLVLRLELRA